MLTDSNFDKKKSWWTRLEVGWKKHAEYMLTRFDSGNTGRLVINFMFYEK